MCASASVCVWCVCVMWFAREMFLIWGQMVSWWYLYFYEIFASRKALGSNVLFLDRFHCSGAPVTLGLYVNAYPPSHYHDNETPYDVEGLHRELNEIQGSALLNQTGSN